jgi:hypothetical protein
MDTRLLVLKSLLIPYLEDLACFQVRQEVARGLQHMNAIFRSGIRRHGQQRCKWHFFSGVVILIMRKCINLV